MANKTDIKWYEIGADDFAATSLCKRYYFRAEKMSKGMWWWSVSFLSEEIGSSWHSLVTAKFKEKAMQLAEECYQKDMAKRINAVFTLPSN